MGIALSVDDFGTGYSSLSYLAKMPINELKVDRSFVSHLPGCPNSAAIVSAIIQLARCLDISVVAEGVETAAQLDYLSRQKCTLMQGYFISRPLPPQEVPSFAAAYASRRQSVPTVEVAPPAMHSLVTCGGAA